MKMIRLKEKYQKEVIPAMMQKFGYKNRFAVPRVEKVVMNTGFGKLIVGKSADEQKKIIESIRQDFSDLAGQRAILTTAKKSISGFKLRKGLAIGVKVTLRGRRMYDFLERLIHIALPRARDFRGIDPASIDRNGNLNIGITEHIFFPEISPEKVKSMIGLEITVVTTAKNHEQGVETLSLLGFPIRKM